MESSEARVANPFFRASSGENFEMRDMYSVRYRHGKVVYAAEDALEELPGRSCGGGERSEREDLNGSTLKVEGADGSDNSSSLTSSGLEWRKTLC